MPRTVHVVVEPRPDGRRAVQLNGALRADSLHHRRAQAIRHGRELAQAKRAELVIKNDDGRIAQRGSYGNDPFPPRDNP